LSGRDNGILYHEVPVSSYPLFEFPPYDLALASRMAEVAEFYELDLLHVHYAIPHSVSALLARQMLAARGRAAALCYYAARHRHYTCRPRPQLPAHHPLRHPGERRVTSISNYLKEETVKHFGITKPIEVVPNFVNCDEYVPIKDEAARAAARLRLAAPGDAILMHLSNFRPVKRVVDVVKVFARVVRELPAQLVLVGDGPERSAAEWLAHDLQINEKVHFMGKQERVNELLPLADLMVMPSELESFWAGGAGGHGVQGSVDRHASGRGAGADRRRGDGAAVSRWECGRYGRRSGGAAEGSRTAGAMREAGRKTAQKRFCSSLVVPQYVRYLRASARRTGNRE